MGTELKLMERAGIVLQENGKIAVELARSRVSAEQVSYTPLRDALQYFSESWNDFLHPALVSLACEAVGGNSKITEKFGAALVLLAGGADVHDDVIDQSMVKASEETIFGKFGKDIAILAGDALLLDGFYLLAEANEELSAENQKKILELVKRAFFEISGAEAEEASMRGRIDISKEKYLRIIHHKVAAGELATTIGGLVGRGTLREVEILAEYGRVYGILMSIRDEIVDLFEQDELSNRKEKEVLPLPLILTLANESKKPQLLRLLQGKMSDREIEEIVDLALDSVETKMLISEMKNMKNQLVLQIQNLRYCRENLELLATATLEDL